MHTRARDESGFGLLELLMAMVMLNIGILAIMATFNAGAFALNRAGRISTAAAIADVQMETFRGLKYANIVQTTPEWNAAVADPTWTADTVYTTDMNPPPSGKALVARVATCPTGVPTNSCDPSYPETGADHRSYRVDTYLYYDTPSSGAQLKTVTVVVRDARDPTRAFARQTSTFDPSTSQ